MFENKVQELESIGKELREKQRIIKENHEPNLKQIAWFTNLRKLLECKIQLYKQLEQTGGDYYGPMDSIDLSQQSVSLNIFFVFHFPIKPYFNKKTNRLV